MIPQACYIALGIVLLPVAAVAAALGGLVKRDWRDGMAARFGLAPRSRGPAPRVVWCSSVGEVNTARRLIEGLIADGGAPVVVATFTPSGLARARALFGGRATVCLAPLDSWPCVWWWMRRVAPSLVVLCETELWPLAIRFAARRGRIVVVNGRLSDRSLPRYRLGRPFLAPAVARLTRVLAQTPEYAERFVALGAVPERVAALGSLKFDLAEPTAPAPEATRLYDAFAADHPVLVAGSTDEGEEAIVLAAARLIRERVPDLRVILAPRHINRVGEVAGAAAGWRVARRSNATTEDARRADVLVIDAMGELAWVYGLARVAFVGGSFGDRGGQNVVEPAERGVPVLTGPHTPNFRAEVEVLSKAGALVVVRNARELADRAVMWLNDEAARREAGDAGRREVEANRGATKRTLAVLGEPMTIR